MNKYIRNITFVSALSLWAMSTTSCTDYLDKATSANLQAYLIRKPLRYVWENGRFIRSGESE